MSFMAGGGYVYGDGGQQPNKQSKLTKAVARIKRIFSEKKWLKFVMFGVAAFLLLIVLIQLFWPSGRAKPFTSVAEIKVGGASEQQIKDKLQAINDNASFKLVMGQKTVDTKYSASGVDINAAASAKNTVKYPLWQRLIPFSLFIGNGKVPVVNIDQQNLNQHAADWSKQAYVAAKNASLKINGTAVESVKEESGSDFKKEDIAKAISKTSPSIEKQTIDVKRVEVKPVRYEKDVKDVKETAQKGIDNPLTIVVEGKRHAAPSSAIAKWIKFNESADKKSLSLDIEQAAFDEYLKPLQASVYKKPGVTRVSMVDGEEVSRIVGEKGKGIDTAKSTETVKKAVIEASKDPVNLVIAALEPTVSYNRSYTKTNKGLSALLADIAKQKGDYSITVRQLGGSGLYGSANGGKQYHPASTYKIFVAYSALKRIESGEMKWEDAATGGNNVDRCFELMIVNSNNQCAEWFGQKISWGAIHNEVRAFGLGSTYLTGSGFRSTTVDQVNFLARIADESILKKESNDKILSAMSRQIYRAGIPAGFGGAVANKVGFLNGLFHDSAIVDYGGNKYLISIYSNGSSWGQVADAARQIRNYFSS